MKLALQALCACGAALIASSASATATYNIAGLAVPMMTYGSNDALFNSQTSLYSGVGSIIVNTVATGPDVGYVCTASLLNATTVLTAAHCIYDHDATGAPEQVTAITFVLPAYGEKDSPTAEKYAASAWAYNPLYDNADHTGDVGSGHDIAMITLGTAATGHDTYSIYTGDPLQQYLEVGTGQSGGPSGADYGTSDFERRTGSNMFEYYGDEVLGGLTDGIVMSDFDDGTEAHDVFGQLGGNQQTGVLGGDSSSAPGDSGGPEFINGQIAAVASFELTAGIFMYSPDHPYGYCGGDSLDPYNAYGSTDETDVLTGLCTNASVGEIAGDTLTAYNLDFINGYIAEHANDAPVPEPATWAMMIVGFGFVGRSLRARRRTVQARGWALR